MLSNRPSFLWCKDKLRQFQGGKMKKKKEASFTPNSPAGLALQEVPVDDGKFQSGQMRPASKPFPDPLRILAPQFHLP